MSWPQEPLLPCYQTPMSWMAVDHVGNPVQPQPGERPAWRFMLGSVWGPDGETLLCQTSEGAGLVYRIKNDAIVLLSQFQEANEPISAAVFINNGKQIAVDYQYTQSAFVFDTETGALVKTLTKKAFERLNPKHPLDERVRAIFKGFFPLRFVPRLRHKS